MTESNSDFTKISGVGQATEQKLKEEGYKTFEDLASAAPDELSDINGISEDKVDTIIDTALDMSDTAGFTTSLETLQNRKENIFDITLGVDKLDDILNGGIKSQSITEFYGSHKTGKSQVAHQMCVNVQLPKKHGGSEQGAIYIDTEQSYRPSRIVEMVKGLDDDVLRDCIEREDDLEGSPHDEETVTELSRRFLSRIYDVQATSSGNQIVMAKKARDLAEEMSGEEYPIGVVVVDSIISHFRAEYVGRGSLAERQQKLQQHMNDLKGLATDYNLAVVITNQVSADPDSGFFGDPTDAVGGNVIEHGSTYRLRLRESKDDKRKVKLVDAPALPDAETVVRVTEDGIVE